MATWCADVHDAYREIAILGAPSLPEDIELRVYMARACSLRRERLD